MTGLDERKAAILSAIVADYVRGGEPVGSKRLADDWDLGVSAATVRADMALLEEAGYITQPHTSAGRIPTHKAYRFYVDALPPGQVSVDEERAVAQALLASAGDLDDLLRRASDVLSQLTRFAALVTTPRLDRSRLRHVELVPMSPTVVLTIFITDNGRVEKRRLELPEPVAEHEVARARHALVSAVSGLRASQARDVVSGLAAGAAPELRPLLEAAGDALSTQPASDDVVGENVIVGGTARLAGGGYFDGLEEVRSVYETLEERVVVLQLLREALAAGDPGVRIGAELAHGDLASCSVIVASYASEGEPAGSLGVLGPVRMDYPRTLASVQAVASSVERALAALPAGD